MMIGRTLGHIVGRLGFVKTGLFAAGAAMSFAAFPSLRDTFNRSPVSWERTANNSRIVTTLNRNNRCVVHGAIVNGVPVDLMIDSGAPAALYFSDSYLGKLGIDRESLSFRNIWPDTRYGNVADGEVQSLRLGPYVAHDVPVKFLDRWSYTFGDTLPLLGVEALRGGLRLEINRDTCTLTEARATGDGNSRHPKSVPALKINTGTGGLY
jgi:hypothetical protein